MIKINDCQKLWGVTRYRIYKQLDLPRDELTDEEYDKKCKDLVYKRGDRGWSMDYRDKVLTMQSPAGATYMYFCDLSGYIK